MTKKDLVSFIAEDTGLTQADSARAFEAIQKGIIKGLNEDGKVTITGYITIQKVHKDASVSKNPRTGEPVNVSERNVAKFKAGSKLKEAIN